MDMDIYSSFLLNPFSKMNENNNIKKTEDVITFSEEKKDLNNRPDFSGASLDFLKPLIKYGQLSTVLSYEVQKSTTLESKLEYGTRKPRIWGIVSGIIYFLICLNMTIIVAKFDFSVSYSKLINMIKRVTYGIFVVTLVTVYYCFQYRGRIKGLWEKILRQGDFLQEQFARSGVFLPSRKTARLVSLTVCVLSVLMGCIHVIVFSFMKCSQPDHESWLLYHAKKMFDVLTLGFWSDSFINFVPPIIVWIFGFVGLILEIITWNAWYFIDAFRVLTAFMVAAIFRALNTALEQKKLGIEHLQEVMDLHCSGTKLLNLFNQLMAPITFTSTVFNILYLCFWTNYCLIGFEFKISYIVGFMTLARSIVVFYIVADVNTQAYQVTTWMENHFIDMDKIPKQVNQAKLTLFSSLIYSKEAIGFRGMHFFTCTQAVNIAIGGLVLTYTVIVNQVATQ